MTLVEGLALWGAASIPVSFLLVQVMYRHKTNGMNELERVRMQEQDDAEQLAYLKKWKENRL